MEDNDWFELYDLKIEIIGTDKPMMGSYKLGDYCILSGEMLTMPENQGFSIYALASIIPLLPAKQRTTDPHDWMTTDIDIAGPDPNCGARYRITRLEKRKFRHSETTAVPLKPGSKTTD